MVAVFGQGRKSDFGTVHGMRAANLPILITRLTKNVFQELTREC